MNNDETRIWRAIKASNLMEAILIAQPLMPDDASADDLLLMTCVIAACPTNGNASLRAMAAAMPHTELNQTPGLQCILRLLRAMEAADPYHIQREVGRIRHYGPNTSRSALAGVLRALRNTVDLAQDDAASAAFWDRMTGLAA